MLKWFLAILFFLQLTGCKTDSKSSAEKWLIASSTSENTVFSKGTFVKLGPDSILFTTDGRKASYHFIMNNNRLLVYDGKNKRLFRLAISGNEMILTELYQQNPLIVKLIKY